MAPAFVSVLEVSSRPDPPVLPPPLALLPPLTPAPVVLLVPVLRLSLLPEALVPPVAEALVLDPDVDRLAACTADGLVPPMPAPIPALLLGEAEAVSRLLSLVVEPCCLKAPAPLRLSPLPS